MTARGHESGLHPHPIKSPGPRCRQGREPGRGGGCDPSAFAEQYGHLAGWLSARGATHPSTRQHAGSNT